MDKRKEPTPNTQASEMIRLLREAQSKYADYVTPKDMFYCGIYQYNRVIHDLRKLGFNITKTDHEFTNRFGRKASYGHYRLTKE